MKTVCVVNVAQLLTISLENVEKIKLVGQWDIVSVFAQVEQIVIVDKFDEASENLLETAELLRKDYPLSTCSSTSLYDDPSPFLPFQLELLAFLVDPPKCTHDRLDQFRKYIPYLLSYMEEDVEVMQVGLAIGRSLVRLFCSIACVQMARNLVDYEDQIFERWIQNTPKDSRIAYSEADLRYAQMEVRESEIRLENRIDPDIRVKYAEELNKFFSENLEPAETNRIQKCRIRSGDKFSKELRSREIELEHMGLRLEQAVADSKGDWTPGLAKKWLQLSEEKENLGEGMNAAIALSGACDVYLKIIGKKPEQLEQLGPTLNRWTEKLEELTYAYHKEAIDRLKIQKKTVIDCLVTLGDLAKVKENLIKLTNEVRQQIDTAPDEFQKSELLADADDLIGTAAIIDSIEKKDAPIEGWSTFHEVYRAIRQRKFLGAAHKYAVPLVSAYAYRPCVVTGIELPNGKKTRWLLSKSSPAISRTISGLFKLALAGLSSNPSPDLKEAWQAYFNQLLGQIGIRRIIELEKKNIRQAEGLIIHTEANGVLIPWSALVAQILEGDHPPIVQVYRGLPPVATSPESDDGAVILNCFSKDDSLHKTFHDLANRLNPGFEEVVCESPADIRVYLQKSLKLIVFVAHGFQQHRTGKMQVTIGNESYPLDEIFDGIVLPKSSVVVCFTCFGGSGIVQATGEWQSLPYRFLDSGAWLVLANQWPAWVDRSVFFAMSAMLRQLKNKALEKDIWSPARSCSEFITQLRKERSDPKFWAGWTVWSGSTRKSD